MRTKMIAGNLVAVLVVGLVSYFLVSGQLRVSLLAEVDETIASDRGLFDQTWRLAGLELTEQAATQAAEHGTRDVFSARDEADTQGRAFHRATEILDWFGRQNRNRRGPAELVAITDDRGVVISRSQDRTRMRGDDLKRQLTTMAGVLETGRPALDVWTFQSGQEKLLQTAIVPIHDEAGTLIGTLVVAYDMSNGMASNVGTLLGCDIAFIHGDAVYSSSLDGDVVESLRGVLFGAQQATTAAALAADGATSEAWLAQLGDVEYTAVTGPLSNSASTGAGFVVLGNRTEQLAKVSVLNTILILTGLGALIVLIFGFLLGNSFIKPIEQMEEGVLAVINGRTDVRLDIVSAELGGLAYRINQLLNVFTGTPEEDADGRVSSPPEAWAGAEGELDIPPAPRTPSAPVAQDAPSAEDDDPEVEAKLAAEPEDAYYRRLFGEYVAAKEAAGENVSNITEDKFVKRLQANEKSLIKKHDCRMVRFQVHTHGTQVNLRPVIIRG